MAELGDTRAAVRRITELQVRFVLNEHNFAKVYYQEAHHLPAEEQARLRKKQRRYVEVWSTVLHTLRPEIDAFAAEDLVHATIGAIQSALVHRSRLESSSHERLLVEAGVRIQFA